MNQNSFFDVILNDVQICMNQCQAGILFIQDGAPCNTAELVIYWFKFCNVELLTPWPGNAPELYPKGNHCAFICIS